jgi:hypothetical protein
VQSIQVLGLQHLIGQHLELLDRADRRVVHLDCFVGRFADAGAYPIVKFRSYRPD